MVDDDGSALRHAIVAGYGPVGRVVADTLVKTGIRVTVIEQNRQVCDRVKRGPDRRFVCGDVCDADVLKQARIEAASVLVLAIPNQEAAIDAVRIARRLAPDLFIAARTNHVSHGMRAKQAGADHVVVEEIVTAEAMDRAVLTHLLGPTGHEAH